MPRLEDALIYKIVDRYSWRQATAAGRYEGSADDHRDGFIHFSARHQLEGTAAKHFAGQTDLLLVAIDPAALGDELKWEPSRGGDLFPHLYGPLTIDAVVWETALPWTGDRHQFPAGEG